MPNGFPEGKFRIVNVETGQCLYKKTGVGGTLDTSGTYDRVGSSATDPDLLIGPPRGDATEAWTCNGGRIVNTVAESAGPGHWALRDDTYFHHQITLVAQTSDHAAKREFKDGRIVLTGDGRNVFTGPQRVLTFQPEKNNHRIIAKHPDDDGTFRYLYGDNPKGPFGEPLRIRWDSNTMGPLPSKEPVTRHRTWRLEKA